MYPTMRISVKRWDDCMYAQYSCFLKKWQADTSSSCRRSRNVQYNWSGWFDNQSETRRSEKRDKGRNKKLRKAYLFGKRCEIFRFSRKWKVFSFYKNTRTTGNFCGPFGVESQWNSVGEQAIWNFVSQTRAEQESEEFLSDWQLGIRKLYLSLFRRLLFYCWRGSQHS